MIVRANIPPDVIRVRADQVREGDEVRHREPYADFIVEEVDNANGRVRLRSRNLTSTCGYDPDDVLWITRR